MNKILKLFRMRKITLKNVINKLSRKLYIVGLGLGLPMTTLASQLLVPEFSDANGRYTISWNMQGLSFPSRLEEFNGNGWKLISTSRSGSRTFDKASDGTWIYRLLECDGEVGCIVEDKKDSVSVQHTPGIPSLTMGAFTDPDGTYDVTWSAASGTVKTYQLVEDNSDIFTVPKSSRSRRFYSRPDGSYSYKVRACNDVSCSPYSSSQTVTVLKIPAIPQNLTASEAIVKDGILRLTWDVSQETVDSYKIIDTTTTIVLKEIAATQVDFVNELRNGSHTFAVKACNDTGCSELSNTVSVSVEMPPEVPAPFVVPEQTQSGRFEVTWDTAGLAKATYSDVYRALDGGELEFYKTVNAADGEETLLSISERFVENGVAAYQVQACNDYGCSEFTDVGAIDIMLAMSEVVADSPTIQLPVPTNDEPAALSGEGGVSGGQATYSISLPVPPGRNEMQPDLSLNYSSDGGENRVGLGWNVSDGGGSIYRCSHIEAIEGENRPYEQSIDDRLCMNGSRLMLDSGAYGQPGSVYFTEIDEFSRVTLEQGSSLDATAIFKVERKDGKIAYYGSSNSNASNKPTGAQAPFSWYLSKLLDRNGNNIKYVYSTGADDKKLSRIVYTGLNNSSGNREVEFIYEATSEFTHGYRQGAEIISGSQLTAIEFFVLGEFSHKISFDYTLNSKGQGLLSSLEYCADQACQNTTKPTYFEYDNHEFSFEKQTLSTNRTLRYRVANDFDGDGTRDLIRLTYLDQIPAGAPIKTELKASSSGDWIDITDEFYNGYAKADSFYPMDRPADFDRDGKADMLGHKQGVFQIGSFDGVGFTSTPSTLTMTQGGRYIRSVNDFNLDGHLDLLTSEGSSAVFKVHLRCPDTPAGEIDFCDSTEINLQWDADVQETIDSVEDFNQDGLPDLLVVDIERHKDTSDKSKILYARLDGVGNLLFDERTLAYLGAPSEFGRNSKHHRLDANGDGLTDLVVYAWKKNELDAIHLYLNRGLKTADNFVHYVFNSPVEGMDPSLIDGAKILDYNNDGKQELMFPGTVVNHYCFTANSSEPGQEMNIGIDYCTNSSENTQILTSPYDSQNKAIYRWDALNFVFDGNWSIEFSETSLELPINIATPEVDFNGDGNNDFIYKLKQIYGGKGNPDGSPGHPDFGDGDGYWPRNHWLGAGASEDATYVVLNKEISTGGLSHSRLTQVHGYSVPEHHWQYSSLSGLGSPDCSYDIENPFYSVDRDEEKVAEGHFHFNSSMIVAAEHQVSNGLSTTLGEDGLNSTCYYYEDAMYSAIGRGFQGFKAIKVEENFADIEHNKVTRTEFYNEFPLTGKPKYSERRLWDEDFSVGQPIDKTYTTWGYEARDNGTYFVFHDKEEAYTYDLTSRQLLSKKITDPMFDDADSIQYGNPTRVFTGFYTFFDGIHVITNATELHYRYDYSDADSWWINKIDRLITRHRPTLYTDSAPGPKPNTESNNQKQIMVNYTWYADGSRQMQEEITQNTISDEKSVTNWEYDSWGNEILKSIIAVTNGTPHTRTSTTAYTADGYFVDKMYNALNHRTDIEVEPMRGQITQSINPNGIVTTNEYDEFGRLLSERKGSLPAVYYAQEWCEGTCADETPAALSVHTTISDGSPVMTEFKDLLGRTIRSESTGFEGNIVKTVVYHPRGYKISESQPSYEGDSEFFKTYSDFDALGRYGKKTIDQSGHTYESQIWHYIYSGFVTEIVLPDGNLTASRVYDMDGRLFSTTDANDSTSYFRYDGAGNQILIQDVEGNQEIHYYDNLGRNIKIDDPDSGVFSVRYNGFGERTSTVDANGSVIRNEYDSLGRPVTRYIDDGAGEVLDATWLYDRDKIGTLSSMVRGDGHYGEEYLYDDYSRKSKTIHTIEGETYESDIYYDSYYNRIKGKRFPGGEVVAYTFDEFGFLLTEMNPLSPDEDYVYYQITGKDARNKVTSQTFGNGLSAHHDFYASTGLIKDVYLGAGSQYLQHFRYDYDDPFGNVTTRSNVVKGVDEVFTYDNLQRLQSSTRHGEVTEYEYDTIGNLLVKSDFASAYAYGNSTRSLGGNAGPHAVREVHHEDGTIYTFDYDANGNMLNSLNRTLIYDAFNKPTRIVENGVITDMAYSPDLRLYKRENPEQTVYYINGNFEKVIEKTTGRISEKTYLSNFVAVETTDLGRELRFMHHDRLTSITAITDGAGSILEERGFDAFGAPLDAEWRSNGGLLNGEFSDRGFTSHKHLDEHKVIHMDGRLYDPLLGRFFNADPIIQDPKNTQSQNAYTYVMNNPLSMIDPTGYSGERIKEGDVEPRGEGLGARTAANTEKDNGKKGLSDKKTVNVYIVYSDKVRYSKGMKEKVNARVKEVLQATTNSVNIKVHSVKGVSADALTGKNTAKDIVVFISSKDDTKATRGIISKGTGRKGKELKRFTKTTNKYLKSSSRNRTATTVSQNDRGRAVAFVPTEYFESGRNANASQAANLILHEIASHFLGAGHPEDRGDTYKTTDITKSPVPPGEDATLSWVKGTVSEALEERAK